MNCDEIREKISMMVDDELSEEDRTFITEHIAACPECMQVYEAFSSISDVLSEQEEVPEDFTESVMRKVHAQTQAPKRKRNVSRVLGLAACIALVLFAGQNLDTPAALSGAVARSDVSDTSAPIPAPTQPNTVSSVEPETASEVNARLMSYGYVTLTNTDSLYNDPAPQTMLEDDEQETQPISKFTGLSENTVSETVNTSTVEEMLSVAEPAQYGLFSTQADYTAIFHDDSNSSYSLEIWIDGDRLYCEDDVSCTAYYAVGSSDQFQELIGQ